MAIGISRHASEAFETAPSGGQYFADEHAVAEYQANSGTEIVMKQLLNASDSEAFDAWLEHIWVTGSGAEEVTPGEGRGLVHHTRLIPSLRIKEQIVSVSLPNNADKLAVPSVLYKVREPGLFPIDDHIAFVRFIQDHAHATPHTEVVWTIKLTPSASGNAFLADSAAVVPFLQNAVIGALAGLAKTVDEQKQKTSGL